MKSLHISLLYFFFLLSPLAAQSHLVILAGASTGSKPTTAGLIINRATPQNEFVFNMTESSPQYAAGLKLHLPLATPFFHEIGVLYTKQTYHYHMVYTYPQLHDVSIQEMKDSKDLLLIPASIGVSMGFLDVTSGLTGIVSHSKFSNLEHIEGFENGVNQFRMGFHAGLRANLGPVAVGIEYQGELSRVGQGMTVNGESLALNNVPGMFMVTLQYKF